MIICGRSACVEPIENRFWNTSGFNVQAIFLRRGEIEMDVARMSFREMDSKGGENAGLLNERRKHV